jgi:hypothetical protein
MGMMRATHHFWQRIRWALAPWALLSLFLTAACGGAQRAEGPVGAAGGTVAEAETSFEQAEQDLQALLTGQDGLAAGAEAHEPPTGDRPDELSQQKALPQRVNRCERACRALASMDRSAERLCQLTGDEDGRCLSVRERVRVAGELVANVCPACG